jgi:hypothetical protein
MWDKSMNVRHYSFIDQILILLIGEQVQNVE